MGVFKRKGKTHLASDTPRSIKFSRVNLIQREELLTFLTGVWLPCFELVGRKYRSNADDSVGNFAIISFIEKAYEMAW